MQRAITTNTYKISVKGLNLNNSKIMESLRLLKLKKIIKPIKFKHCSSQRLISRNISPYKTNSKTQNEIPNTSWDFTPFPDLYFPSEKKQIIRKINK